jgi:hypothetical protein
MYRKAAGELSHGGADRDVPAVRAALFNWMSEGAYYTSAANQNCP